MGKILALTSETSGDLSIVFPEPIVLDKDKKYEIALHSASLWYSWSNVDSSFGNNVIKYNNGVDADKTITFPSGNYSVLDLTSYIHKIMKENGDYTVVSDIDTFDINFVINYSTIQVEILLTNSFEIDFTGSSFGDLIGFEANDYTSDSTSTKSPDITRGVDSLWIKCDIITGSYINGVRGRVLYQFVPSSSPGGNISISPRNLIFVGVDTQMITKIEISVTDQQNRSVDFRGEGSAYLLHLREAKN